jgi:hypothetical protein
MRESAACLPAQDMDERQRSPTIQVNDGALLELALGKADGTRCAAVFAVLAADEDLLRLIAEVLKILDEIEPQVRNNITADLHAARSLSEAARAIQSENIRELRQRMHTDQ